MTRTLRVGSRRSTLARAQAGIVFRGLGRRYADLDLKLVTMATSGDARAVRGSSPDFTDTLDRALLRGRIDLAVHSAKDLPATLAEGLRLVSCPRRADNRDCLVLRRSPSEGPLAHGARVGSSSVRRRAQLLRWRSDLKVVQLRGNVDSRLARVDDGSVDAAILAVAGLLRLGREDRITTVLPRREFLPAPAQGALAVVVRSDDRAAAAIAASVDHRATFQAVAAERAFVRELGGDCDVPIGAHATVRDDTLVLTGEVLSPDGRKRLRGITRGPRHNPLRLGRTLGRSLLEQGARELLLGRGR